MPQLKNCQVCDSNNLCTLHVKEEMYGLQNTFLYGECKNCGHLQLLDIPSDLSVYYPQTYYSYSNHQNLNNFKNRRRSLIRKTILNHPQIFTPIYQLIFKKYRIFWLYRLLGINKNSKTLDVGSGSGAHVLELRGASIKQALGLDLFVPTSIFFDNELLVQKGTLEEHQQKYDLISFHHSLEHIPNQFETLTHAKNLLNEGGHILIRVPTVSSNSFKIYREKWFHLDAPRHIALHSITSIKILANNLGMRIKLLQQTSSLDEYIYSEQYKKNISLHDENSYLVNRKDCDISAHEISKLKKLVTQDKVSKNGGELTLILEKVN